MPAYIPASTVLAARHTLFSIATLTTSLTAWSTSLFARRRIGRRDLPRMELTEQSTGSPARLDFRQGSSRLMLNYLYEPFALSRFFRLGGVLLCEYAALPYCRVLFHAYHCVKFWFCPGRLQLVAAAGLFYCG